MSSKQAWIGLFTLVPTVDNYEHGKYKGVCVNVLALADDEAEFLSKVKETCAQMHFVVQEAEDPELFDKRASEYEVDQQLQKLAEDVVITGEVLFGNMHKFQHDDA